MVDTEFLQAFSEVIVTNLEAVYTNVEYMMDTKLEGVYTNVEKMMDTKLEAVYTNVEKMMDTKLEAVYTNVEKMMDEKLDTKLAPVLQRIDHVEVDIKDINHDIKNIKNDIRRLDMKVENEVMPQLREIQTLYVDTFDRYRVGIKDIDEMKADIRHLKAVVSSGKSA